MCRYLDREEVEEMEDGGLAVFESVLHYIEGLVGKESKEIPAPAADGVDTSIGEHQLPLPQATSMTPENWVPFSVLSTLMKRDFKVVGQIGEPGQKDKISYTSFVRQ